MRALLIANAEDADSGFVGQRLRHHGYSFVECHREHPDEWPELAGHDLVLSLGSEWSVYWPEVADSVAAEAGVIQAAHTAGVPVFGICYGNQMMAHALGGTVERAREPEVGWMDIVSDEPMVIAEGPWMQWHSDVVTVPGNATELARSAAGPQAWHLGRSFCTQFHPEVNEGIIHRWAHSAGGVAELTSRGSSPDELLAITRANVDEAQANSDRIVDWFCETIATTHPGAVLDLR